MMLKKGLSKLYYGVVQSLFFLYILFLFGFSSKSFSQPGGDPPQIDGIWDMVWNGVEYFFYFVGIIAVIMVVYGAYMWMLSSGDPQKVKQAQGVLTWSVIGLILYSIIFILLSFVFDIFGVDDGAFWNISI